MLCQRCGKNEGEFFCSICNRIICQDCKVMDSGKIYCLDHVPKKELASQVQQQPQQFQPQPQSGGSKVLKDLIWTDITLLIGFIVIFTISNIMISGTLASNYDVLKENFPQLTFVFTLMSYFTSFGLISIITLFIILVVLLIILKTRKRQA